MNDKLLPCPFCGGEAQLEWPHEGGAYIRHDCDFVTGCWYETEYQAIEAWNTRADARTRYAELFGTPERAARTLHCDKEPICAGCALMDECKKTPDEEYDTCFLLDYDVLLEWLRGDAE